MQQTVTFLPDDTQALFVKYASNCSSRGLPRKGLARGSMPRAAPNILVCGTPGTGKTTLCQQVAEATGLKHINIGDLVKAQSLHSGWDDEFECLVIDEDKVGSGPPTMHGAAAVAAAASPACSTFTCITASIIDRCAMHWRT